jgi:hypothetical protein
MGEESFADASGKYFFGERTAAFLKEHLPYAIQLDISTDHVDEPSAHLLSTHLRSPHCPLRSLLLAHCRMTFRASSILFQSIGGSPLLELYLDANLLDDQCCKALSAGLRLDPALELLSVVGCQITSDGANHLCASLPYTRHLHHLRLDSNSLYSEGLSQLCTALGRSRLETLSLSDNQIWREGTTRFLEALCACDILLSLDIGFNAIDLDILRMDVQMSRRLERLCISGCKVAEARLNDFLEAVGRSRIQCLMVDGLNFHVMPINCGYCEDRVWRADAHLDNLIRCILNDPWLNDIRIGFLDINALFILRESLRKVKDRDILFSIHDFGGTNNAWVVHFPSFRFESPTDVWRVCSPFPGAVAARRMGEVFNQTTCDSRGLAAINLGGLHLNDEQIANFFATIEPCHLRSLDLSGNPALRDSLESVVDFLRRGGQIDDLNCYQVNFSLPSIVLLFQFFNDAPARTPASVQIDFDFDSAPGEFGEQPLAGLIGNLIACDCPLRECYLSGQISCSDVARMVEGLHRNSHLQVLEVQSHYFNNYQSPDPALDPSLQVAFDALIDQLHKALTKKRTMTVLHTFNFPLLTEIYLYSSVNIARWPEILQVLNANHDGE